MGNENGVWVMHGLRADDPACLHTAAELSAYVEKVGFLPLFANGIPGFSTEEHTEAAYWWSGDPARDPWEWREIIAREGRIAYGKFFDKKAGFISREWLPYFANYRRDGYDFDALFADGKAKFRQKRIMDLFEKAEAIPSPELKEAAGFGKGGEKNFEGILTALETECYLCVKEFCRRRNRQGELYGWPVAVYTTPEALFGYDHVASAYAESPARSRERILAHLKTLFPNATDKQLSKI